MKLLKVFKYLFSFVSIAATIGLTTSCSHAVKQSDSLYNKDYNVNSQESYEISKITLSLSFYVERYLTTSTSNNEKEIIKQSGTGWVFKANSSNFYIATNVHVANILTFENKTVKMLDESTALDNTSRYGKILGSSVKVVKPSVINSTNNSYFETNQLSEVFVSTPSIIYTTINDAEYNAAFPEKVNGRTSYGVAKYTPITDIAILKYSFLKNTEYYVNNYNTYIKNKEESISGSSDNSDNNTNKTMMSSSANLSDISEFLQWLNNYSSSTISIMNNFDSYSDYDKYTFNYYMGGFPNYRKNSLEQDISWLSFSNFNMNKTITDTFQYSWDKYQSDSASDLSVPISYYVDAGNQQFISAGKEGYFFANSYSGSSGSAIVAKINNKLYIVGIYWGTITFNVNGIIRTLGVCDFLDSSKNKKFNIVDSINKKIDSIENTN